MLEGKFRPEQKKLVEVVGNVDLARKKLTAKPGFIIAFLLSDKDFKVYVSPDNSHEKAAKMAGLPSNNSKEVLLKGRIVPQTTSFDFDNKRSDPEGFLMGDLDDKFIDDLVPEVAAALKNWLGNGFEGYNTHYKKHNFDRSPESRA